MGLFSTLFGRNQAGTAATPATQTLVPTTTTVNTTQTSRPGNYDYLRTGVNSAHALFTSGGPSLVGAATVADMDRGQTAALRGLQRAAMGDPLLAQAQQAVSGYLSGGQQNPWIDQLWQQGVGGITAAYEQAVGNTAASAIAAGRLGSPVAERQRAADQAALAGQLGSLHTQLYAQDFKDRQTLQQQAVEQAIALQRQQLAGLAQAADAGAQFQAQNQARLDAQVAADPYNLRLQKLKDYAGLLGGFDTGGTTTTHETRQGYETLTQPGRPGTPATRTLGVVGWLNQLAPAANAFGSLF